MSSLPLVFLLIPVLGAAAPVNQTIARNGSVPALAMLAYSNISLVTSGENGTNWTTSAHSSSTPTQKPSELVHDNEFLKEDSDEKFECTGVTLNMCKDKEFMKRKVWNKVCLYDNYTRTYKLCETICNSTRDSDILRCTHACPGIYTYWYHLNEFEYLVHKMSSNLSSSLV